jgi:hypothetical protein
MKKLYSLILFTSILAISGSAYAQNFGIVLFEDFDLTTTPVGWTQTTEQTFPTGISSTTPSGGWVFGQGPYTSTFWTVPASIDGSPFAISNDDAADQNRLEDLLMSPVMDLSTFDSALFLFDVFYDGLWDAEAYWLISYDAGTNWLNIPINDSAVWAEDGFLLPSDIVVGGNTYSFNDQMMIGFLHSDAGVYGSGFAIDNVIVGGYNNPCDDVIAIAGCNAPQTVTLGGVGTLDWEFVTGCGFTTFGAEQLYSFTPSVSGVHTIEVTSSTETNFFDYMYKPVSTGCDTLGWTCVSDVLEAGNYGGLNLTAGTQYYILVDAEFIDQQTQTFSIQCPCTYASQGNPAESEACGTDLNGGCNNDPSPETYEPITCGQSISGTLWANGGNRDTDWFELVVTENTNIVVDYSGAMPINAVLIDNCTDFTLLGEATSTACGTGSLTYSAAPGTYIFALVPTGFEGYPCGSGANDYDVTITYCAAPANDLCVNAEPLQCDVSTVGTTVGATAAGSPNSCDALATDLGVWYTFTGTGGGVKISTCGPTTAGSAEQPWFAVYSGPTCAQLTCEGQGSVAIADPACGSAASVFYEFTTTVGLTYYVFVTAASGAPATIDFDLTLTCDPITGIEDGTLSDASVMVYPNPSNGTFTVEMNGAEGAAQLTVTDMVGKVVYSEAVVLTNDFRKGLDLNLSAGSYILNVASDKHNLIQKLEVR